MEPSAQDIRDWLGQITPTPLALGIDWVAHDAEIRLLRMPHHRRGHLFLVVRHRVSVWLHHRVGVLFAAVYHRGLHCRLRAVFVGVGVCAGRHSAVVSLSLIHAQVADWWEDGAGASRGTLQAHGPVAFSSGCVFMVAVVGCFRGCGIGGHGARVGHFVT